MRKNDHLDVNDTEKTTDVTSDQYLYTISENHSKTGSSNENAEDSQNNVIIYSLELDRVVESDPQISLLFDFSECSYP